MLGSPTLCAFTASPAFMHTVSPLRLFLLLHSFVLFKKMRLAFVKAVIRSCWNKDELMVRITFGQIASFQAPRIFVFDVDPNCFDNLVEGDLSITWYNWIGLERGYRNLKYFCQSLLITIFRYLEIQIIAELTWKKIRTWRWKESNEKGCCWDPNLPFLLIVDVLFDSNHNHSSQWDAYNVLIPLSWQGINDFPWFCIPSSKYLHQCFEQPSYFPH